MTKETYFEMCEMLGQEPNEDEIPVDLEDLPDLVQQCFVVYNILSDNWDPMGGNYLGKDYSIVFKLFDVYEISDNAEKLLCLEFLQQVDSIRSKLIHDKNKRTSPQH